MAEIAYRRHRFQPVIIPHAVWLYLRFTLSCKDVEELLAVRIAGERMYLWRAVDHEGEVLTCWSSADATPGRRCG